MGKKIGAAVIIALSLIGSVALVRGAMQAYEDYSNFRKIVIWVAQKQAQEADYARRQQAQQAQRAAPGPVPAPSGPQ